MMDNMTARDILDEAIENSDAKSAALLFGEVRSHLTASERDDYGDRIKHMVADASTQSGRDKVTSG